MSLEANAGSLCHGCFAAPAASGPCPDCGFDGTAPRPAVALPIGSLLDAKYLVGRVLGRPGGFGIAYLAYDRALETPVAIKEYLPRDLAARDTDGIRVLARAPDDDVHFRYGLSRFLGEARTLAQLDHPNIFRIRQFFEANGTAYLVTDYNIGSTLAEYLERQPGGRMPEDQALAVMAPILDGLRAVHAKGFLHRDIKPANIYLARTESGSVRPTLLGFDSARQAVGEHYRWLSVTERYACAPVELYQRKGRRGPWSDVYAAAAVLYRMVTGEMPPTAMERAAGDPLTPLQSFGCSRTFSEAIAAGLTMEPGSRPQDVDAFRALLAGGEPVLAHPAREPDDGLATCQRAAHRSAPAGRGPARAPVTTGTAEPAACAD